MHVLSSLTTQQPAYIKRPDHQEYHVPTNNYYYSALAKESVLKVVQANPNFFMALLVSFFSCFSGSQVEEGSPSSIKANTASKAKLKESKAKKSPPIPMTNVVSRSFG
ncbi:hypothetical protein ES332_A10G013400v1 [Gossypium tomentosum]|uniref:Uncharacterized protein n=1 Tax=Gossypium tomentosum TaxID=34277 RepID=A0A5D2NJS1_GOSTO|nr:hypothetical protein ES332_A10G013400v1 [Gossypium tomentosum]